MSTLTSNELEIKAVVDKLIQTATNYDAETLEDIYHDDLQVYMLGTSGGLQTASKEAFTSLFVRKRDAGDPPMNTWAKFHKVEADGDSAHVLLSRKNDLSDEPMKLHLSIDLQKSANRWQVTREVIFLFSDSNENADIKSDKGNKHV